VSLQGLAAQNPEVVERLFSRRVFPALARVLTCASARLSFSAGEVLFLASLLMMGALALRTLRRPLSWKDRLSSLLSGLLLASGLLYLVFLLVWGLNYSRQPFAASTGLDVRPAPVEELEALARALVGDANEARQPLVEDADGVMRLADGQSTALDLAEAGFVAAAERQPLLRGRCARPKALLLSPVAARLGITGIYSPLTGEANVNSTVPDPELPFAACHEIAHARGFAREEEANYLGYLACRLHPDADFRYAGLLAASVYVQNALYRARRSAWEETETMRAAGVQRDLRALVAWSDRYRGRATDVAERLNDAYLKAQGQPAGAQSYGHVVDLLLAERRTGGVPRAR